MPRGPGPSPDLALAVVPWRRSGTGPLRRAVLSLTVKRLVAAVDPETAASQRHASTQEGGLRCNPAKATQTVKLPSVF